MNPNYYHDKKMNFNTIKTKFCLLIYFFMFLICFHPLYISCNIWDNIFSNLSSPATTLPEEFCIELYDTNNEKLKVGEVWVSTVNNKIKLSIFDKIKEINFAQTILDGNYTNLIKNFLKWENLNIFENDSRNNKELFSIILNFNSDSSITFLSRDFCQIQKNKKLNRVGVKLILISYDMFTYFEENSKKENITYNDYIFTNSFTDMNLKNKNLDFLSNAKGISPMLKNFLPLFQNIISENYKKEFAELKNTIAKNITELNKNLVDKMALIVFRVNKQTQKLEKISLKYDDIEYYSLSPEVKTFDFIEDKIFDPVHIKNDGVLCEIMKEGDKKEKSIIQFLIENVFKSK